MIPQKVNGVKPKKQDSLESWHQVFPQPPPRTTHNTDRYKWDDINALFEDQVQMVSVSHLKAGTINKPKEKKVRLPGNIKIKRLVKFKAAGKRFYSIVADVSGKSKRWRLKLGNHGKSVPSLLQRATKKKFKKAIRVTKAHK